jgi:hypothetical protein
MDWLKQNQAKKISTTMKQLKSIIFFATLAAVLCGCGDGGAASTNIAGSVSGLSPGTTLVLVNSGMQTVSVTQNGNFFFNGQVKAGTAYSVTVYTNPPGESCTVTNGTGIVGQYGEDVSNILVTCVVAHGTVFGVVSGLDSGATLSLQNQTPDFFGTSEPDSVTVKANGGFAFPVVEGGGVTYNVIVSEQPAGQTCDVTNGTGTIPAKGAITAILVACH